MNSGIKKVPDAPRNKTPDSYAIAARNKDTPSSQQLNKLKAVGIVTGGLNDT
jgi:hypothetical protein